MSEAEERVDFFDTSALVKRYHREVGTDVVDAAFADKDGIRMISDMGVIEFYSAFAKKVRTGEITEEDFRETIKEMAEDIQSGAIRLTFYGGSAMHKLFVGSIILVLCTLGWSNSSFGQEVPAPRGELRIVDKHPGNWASLVFKVFEHLMEPNPDGTLVPRLATGWQWLDDRTLEVTLRQGVRFHNGEVFDAEIVKLNWEENTRLRQPHRSGTYMNFKPGSRLDIVTPQIVRFIFPEPDGGALAKLVAMHLGNRQFYRELGWGEKSW